MQFTDPQQTLVVITANAGAVSSEELVRGYLDRAESLKRLNVFVHLDREQVLAQARAVPMMQGGDG